MHVYPVPAQAGDVVHWLKEEAERGPLDFYVNAWKQYRLEEEFDHAHYPVEHPEDFDLVSVNAGVDVEPRVEQNYWILQVRVKKVLGLCRTSEEESYFDDNGMTLDAFEEQFLDPGDGATSVRLVAETREARAHFDDWFTRFVAKHAQQA